MMPNQEPADGMESAVRIAAALLPGTHPQAIMRGDGRFVIAMADHPDSDDSAFVVVPDTARAYVTPVPGGPDFDGLTDVWVNPNQPDRG